MDEIEFEGSFDQNKQCIGIDGEGAGFIKFTTDATQLATMLSVFAKFTKRRFKIKLIPLAEDYHNESGNTQTIR